MLGGEVALEWGDGLWGGRPLGDLLGAGGAGVGAASENEEGEGEGDGFESEDGVEATPFSTVEEASPDSRDDSFSVPGVGSSLE